MGKNSTRLLVIVGLILLIICSWYTLITDTQEVNDQYNSYLESARYKATLGLYEDALDYYIAAMNYRDNIDLRDEVAQFYKDNVDAVGYESFCETIVEDYPYEAVGYERLALLYKETGAYYTCFSVVESAEKREVQSKTLDAIVTEMAYEYELLPNSAVNVSTYSAGYCAVQRKSGLWGFVNNNGDVALSSAYLKVSPFSTSGLAAVQMQDGSFALIDLTGRKKSVDPLGRKIEDCKALISDKMAVKYDGKYHYCDAAFNELFGSYDYAGAFYCGVAAVQNNGKWAIIDESGNQVTDYIYDDIKLDDKGMAFRGNRAIAKLNGSYIVIDTKGSQVGSEMWEDADAFNADLIAAVKKNGQWGFVNSEGVIVADYQFKEAKSFSNGLAAVMIDEKWGYIDSYSYTLKIDAIFDAACDFATNGNAFVQENGQWSLLRIYRLS